MMYGLALPLWKAGGNWSEIEVPIEGAGHWDGAYRTGDGDSIRRRKYA